MSQTQKIIIDARFYGTEHTGLGRYTTNVLKHLPRHLRGQSLKVLLRRKYYESLSLPSNCEKILADIPHYSLREQLELPGLVDGLSGDLYYALHFNVPLFLKKPYVVTIHDLIKSHFTGSNTTTRAPWLFALKRRGYEYTMRRTISRARSIIVPSNTVKNDILALFNADPTSIRAIAEAPDDIFRTRVKVTKKDYLLYVGNAYPHKNLDVLLRAVTEIPGQELVIVSKNTPFLTKVLDKYDSLPLRIMSDIDDSDLLGIYAQARALITPSLMEGYDLPGLEALMVGTRVIASDIPVHREVYKNSVTYFDPHSANDLVRAIKSTRTPAKMTIKRTWGDAAAEIAEVIRESSAGL